MNGRLCVQTFEIAKGNMPANAFAVRLKVEQQNAETFPMEHQSALQHGVPVRPHAMQKHDYAVAWCTGGKPPVEHGAGRRRKDNGLGAQLCRRRRNGGLEWLHNNVADQQNPTEKRDKDDYE